VLALVCVAAAWTARAQDTQPPEPRDTPAASAPVEPAPAPVESAPAPADVPAALQEARESLKNGDYDHAIEVLRAALPACRTTEERRETYLLLIKTYVFLGNDLKFRPQGREASNLNYKEAGTLVAEALRVPELRHLEPQPATDYPPEMLSLFANVRAEIFGTLRIRSLEPADAVVVLDGDTLRAATGGDPLVVPDLAVGTHDIVVRSPGYEDRVDTITIAPGTTLEASYHLEKRRTKGWYAVRATGVGVLVGGIVALVASGDSSTEAPQPLPGPPLPPSR
jgi:hypothetical protein